MPPAAIASSVVVTMSSSPRRSRNSSVDAGGNFGAPPNPPRSASNVRRRPRTASDRTVSVSGSADGSTSLDERTASTSCAADRPMSSRRSRYAVATAPSTCRKLGSPCRGAGG